ncbi:hypothetical protein N7495_004389 [Penicillium taxi]|uniref:uncharacterized protein n=1 Tax=Penicillium taxi TaxID=168475 RepID=UPI0025454FB2|nr:uncharacterized protein N7495_004389 [Penicillium taxi]KAJ5899645.1 hypothetical protein N7495_004389 [Penicillium taxi]
MPESYYPSHSLARVSTRSSTSSRDTQSSDESQQTHRSINQISSKLSWSKSKSPSHFDIPLSDLRQSSDTFTSRDIPRSTPYSEKTSSDMSHTFHPHSPKPELIKREPSSIRKSNDDYRRYSGTVNHYGRHSNDWLFGGFSVREAVRDGFEKLYRQDKGS